MALVLCTGVDPSLMETRRLILEQSGHQVVSVTTEQELEKASREHRFDVAMIGQTMSAKVKPRVFTLLREHCPSAAVLELYPQYSERTLTEADAWLAMPTENPQELADAVDSLARNRTGS